MSSYQDIDVRLAVVEDKLDFVMKTFSVSKRYRSPLAPEQEVVETKSLLELYREVKGAGLIVLSPEEAAKEDQKQDTGASDGSGSV